MEHREAPRLARLLAAPGVRRVSVSRLGWVLVAAAAVAAGGVALVRMLAGWLPGQPAYRIEFREIVLEPPPPGWYRGGSRVFLDRVRAAALVPDETLSVLDCDVGRLRSDFQKYPWVDRVVRIRRVPPVRQARARLIVELEYLEPVAVAVPGDPKRPEYLLDASGRIVPGEDVDRARAGPLIPIHHLAPPFAPRPGQVWKQEGATPDLGQDNPRAVAAAQLAGFLKHALERGETVPRPSPPPLPKISFDRNGGGPFVAFDQWKWLLWGDPPGQEPPGQPTASEKWSALRAWVESHPPDALTYPCFLRFSGPKLEIARGAAHPSVPD